MAKISVYNFSGEMPRVEPRLLNDSYATVARNVELRRGQIAPARGLLDLSIPLLLNTETIYQYNKEANGGAGFWFQFATDVDVVRGPIAGDTLLRTYWTGDGVPQFSVSTLAQQGGGPYPGASYDLGLPAPASLTATGPVGSPPEGGQEVRTAYVMTFVSEFGEEGPPSLPTVAVTRWDGTTVALSNLDIPSGNFNVVAKRLYRVELTGNYQFVAEVLASATTFDDSIASEELGEIVPSTGWIAPDPNMVGLTELPNGILMGWFGNTLAFCEPYQPHAWPTRYQLALDDNIVGAAVSSAGIVVVTTGKPYLVTGVDPASMSQIKLDVVQACVSKRSVVDMGEYILYASSDGIVAAGGASAELITEPMFLPAQWRSQIQPESIHAYRYDDRYLAFYDNGATKGAFSFHPSDGFRFFDEYADAGYVDTESGRLYVKQGAALKAWDEGTPIAYTWRSKVWQTPDNESITVCKVDSDSYPLTFDFYTDEVLVKSKTVVNNKAFRLPAKSRYRDIQFEVTGTAPINTIQLATEMSEVA